MSHSFARCRGALSAMLGTLGLVVAMTAGAASAAASEDGVVARPIAASAAIPDGVPAEAAASPFRERPGSAGARRPVDATSLSAYRGGAATVDNLADVRGTVGNNSATQVVTGSNAVTDGAFANASGLSTVIQNSGANVLIQNSTIVNVQFK